jgi:ParB/Sulfiredoxin domain
MTRSIKKIDIKKVKSWWYKDIFNQWQPDMNYIDHIITALDKGSYISPIVVVQEEGIYYIVNGHHRYYAHLKKGEQTIKCIVIPGTFEESEPLRKAEVLLKEFDQKTQYRYQISGYLDRWAADAEEHSFINKYKPTYTFRIYTLLKKIINKITSKKIKQ